MRPPPGSTGTTPATNRAEVVALAMHYWAYTAAADPSRVFGWGPYTNGFVERDEVRLNNATGEVGVAWSWAFASSAGTFETTATVTNPAPSGNDTYYAMLVVYAATQPVVVPAPTTLATPPAGPVV